MPQWKAENEATRLVDGIISRLASVNDLIAWAKERGLLSASTAPRPGATPS